MSNKVCGMRGVEDAAPYGRIIDSAAVRADVGISPYGYVIGGGKNKTGG